MAACRAAAQLPLSCPVCVLYFLNLERVANQLGQAGVWIKKGSVNILGQDLVAGPPIHIHKTLLTKYLGGPWLRLALT